MVGTPWQIDGERFTVGRPPPRLGEHTAEVLAEVAGLSEEQIRELV
jgi:crotonobetainyl-CoA:carnitine CoA-transferase CaiB-like acyl-CoA transferase